jgi:amidase
VPLAPSFDTVGWFARNADTLAAVGEVLLGEEGSVAALSGSLLVAEDAFGLAEPGVRSTLSEGLDKIRGVFSSSSPVAVSAVPLSQWRETFRTIQAYEAWQAHGAWIKATQPSFGPGVRERFAYAATVTREAAEAAQQQRRELIHPLLDSLGDGELLCLPTCPDVAPLRTTHEGSLEAFRNRLLELTAIAGLAGLPQVTIPVATVAGIPVGLSFIAPRGADRRLLSAAQSIARLL